MMHGEDDAVVHDASKDPVSLDGLIEQTRTMLSAIPDLSVSGKLHLLLG
jgi:hypothetical protein